MGGGFRGSRSSFACFVLHARAIGRAPEIWCCLEHALPLMLTLLAHKNTIYHTNLTNQARTAELTTSWGQPPYEKKNGRLPLIVYDLEFLGSGCGFVHIQDAGSTSTAVEVRGGRGIGWVHVFFAAPKFCCFM